MPGEIARRQFLVTSTSLTKLSLSKTQLIRTIQVHLSRTQRAGPGEAGLSTALFLADFPLRMRTQLALFFGGHT